MTTATELLETLEKAAGAALLEHMGKPAPGFIIMCGDDSGNINMRSNIPMHQVLIVLSAMLQQQIARMAQRNDALEKALLEHAPQNEN